MEIIKWSKIKEVNKSNIDEFIDEFDFKKFRKAWNLRHKDIALIFGVSIKAVEKMEQENSTHIRNISKASRLLNDIAFAFEIYNNNKNDVNLDLVFSKVYNLQNYKDINERPYLKLHYINSKTKENSYSEFNYLTFLNALTEIIAMNKEGISASKISKLIYILDYNHFQEHGMTFTGVTYRKFSNAPMIEGIHELLEYFEMQGILRSNEDSNGHKLYFSNAPATYEDVLQVIKKYLIVDNNKVDELLMKNFTFVNTSILENLLIQKD